TSVPIPKGTNVIISILSSNRNLRVWGEDADGWCPTRWLTATGERVGAGRDANMEFGDESGALPGDGAGAGAKAGDVKYPGCTVGCRVVGCLKFILEANWSDVNSKTFLGGNCTCM
ncbi:hypothetical protein C2E23DRAFT_724634, partial [Lenzites betulinus]